MGEHGMKVEWGSVERGRALALACRLDRRLHDAGETASRPEHLLAERLRQQLRRVVTAGPTTAQLFHVVATVHEQLAFLPKPDLPTGLRVFLREVFGEGWDEEVVVAAGTDCRWLGAGGDVHGETGGAIGNGTGGSGETLSGGVLSGDGAQPVAVIPGAEVHNPLMWPLAGLQVGGFDGWEDAIEKVQAQIGTGLSFARAEALVATDAEGARKLWEQGMAELAGGGGGEGAVGVAELSSALADGVLISAHRRGSVEKAGGVYGRLAQAHDEPAQAADILQAGWRHWYAHGLPQLLELEQALVGGSGEVRTGENRGATAVGAGPAFVAVDAWVEMGRLVNGIDDLLCRSLDVAAVHRFYATGGVGG